MADESGKETLWVVVRLDLYHGGLDPAEPLTTITLKEAVPTHEEADAEVARLNALKDPAKVTYFASPVSWYPNGRNVRVKY